MYTPAHPLLFFIYLFFFFFFKEKADWDGVPPLYSEAGGLKVASPGVLFLLTASLADGVQHSCIISLPPVAISSVLLSLLVFFILFFLKLYDAAQMHI